MKMLEIKEEQIKDSIKLQTEWLLEKNMEMIKKHY